MMTTHAYLIDENGQRLQTSEKECNDKNDMTINPADNPVNINIEQNNKQFNKQIEDIEGINILYSNVDSLSNKIDELKTYIDLYKSDIILLTETLPKNPSNQYENVFNIEGFSSFEDITGRGVCIFYKEHLNVTILNKINDMYHPSIFMNIKYVNKSFNIGLVYRSPNNDFKENKKLNNQINFASKKLKNLVIFGDFNHPSIDWDYNSCNKNEEHPDSMFLFEFIKWKTNQLITKTTHHKPNCKPSTIDLILTKTPDVISNIKHCPPIGKSHHDTLTAILIPNSNPKNKINKVEHLKVLKPNFDKANFVAINEYFDKVDWSESLKDLSVEEAWCYIKDKIETAQSLFVPNKYINPNKVRPCSLPNDDTLHSLLKNKRYLFKTYKKIGSKLSLYNYNAARNKVSNKIKQLKTEKEKRIAKNIKSNTKAFYQYISSKVLKKEGIAHLINENNELTTNDKEKCDVINNFFSSVFTTEDPNNVPEFKCDKDIPNPLLNCNVSFEEFEKALLNLNPNKSPGPDNFHPKFLKLTAKTLAKPIKLLFDLTLVEGNLPSDFKIAEVRPIYKKGDKSHAGNYRPVSLTSVICKVMETFIKNSLNNHLINNDLLSKHQFGFVSGRSTVTQLLVTLNEWLFGLDNNVPIDAAYMDFRKAFDTVPHQRLLNKLKGYNITGPILNWISSFLSDRYQFVKINNSCSSKLKVTSGVPQGSVLGPTLFVFFINDLPNVVFDTSIKIFADDTKAYKEIRNNDDVNKLQKAIDEMFEWTQKWLLKFNEQKCKMLHLGNNNTKNEYFIGTGDQRIPLEKSDLEKDLGIYIDENLNFKEHIKITVKKSNYACYKILKNFTFKDDLILVPLFKSLVRPILEYGNVVWKNCIKKYMNKIENVQRKFTRHIKGLQNTSYEERLKKIKLPSLEYRQLRNDMIQVFKIAKNFYDPVSTNSVFEFANNSRLRGHTFKINKQHTNKSKYKNFFSNRIVNNWNRLPKEIVNAESLNEFKNKFDEFNKDIMFSTDIDYYT